MVDSDDYTENIWPRADGLATFASVDAIIHDIGVRRKAET